MSPTSTESQIKVQDSLSSEEIIRITLFELYVLLLKTFLTSSKFQTEQGTRSNLPTEFSLPAEKTVSTDFFPPIFRALLLKNTTAQTARYYCTEQSLKAYSQVKCSLLTGATSESAAIQTRHNREKASGLTDDSRPVGSEAFW